MFFHKKSSNDKNEGTVTNVNNQLWSLYLNNVSEYIRFIQEISYDSPQTKEKEFIEAQSLEYYNACKHFVDFMIKNYSKKMFDGNNLIDLDIEKMTSGAKRECLNLFYIPRFSDLIYIDDKRYSTHFHTDGKFITEAENLHALPNLNTGLLSGKLNKIFVGLTIPEARDLLKQMNILPPNSELDREIINYQTMYSLHNKFLLSIIYLLLMDGEVYNFKRAKLFADSLGVIFNFEAYEPQEEIRGKKLTFNQNNVS